jgi:PAS domain S-box-containing protein
VSRDPLVLSLEQFFGLRFRVGVSVADLQTNPYVAVSVNDDLCEFLGRTRRELLEPGMFAHISHPDDLEHERPMMVELIAGRRDGYDLIKRYLRPDGEQVRAYVDVSLVRDDAGEPDKAIGMILEVKSSFDDGELRELFDRRRQLELELAVVNLDLAVAALRASDRGASRRAIADSLGVAESTVQGWIARARELRR